MTAALHLPAVYRIENTATGHSYVGSSKCVHIRLTDHLVQLIGGVHANVNLQDSVDRHGITCLKLSLLELVPDERLLRDRETYWMHEMNPIRLYNTKDGRGRTLSGQIQYYFENLEDLTLSPSSL